MNKDTVILTTATCDNEYRNVFRVFITSLRENIPEQNRPAIIADLINVDDKTVKTFTSIYPNLKVNSTLLPGADWTDRNNTIQIMRIRPHTLLATMNEGWRHVVTIDCDSIIRGDIKELWNDVGQDNIKILYRPERKNEFTRFQAGVWCIGNSEITRRYWRELIDFLGNNWTFYDGQTAMYKIWFQKYRHAIPLIKLEKKFNDWEFNKKSIIWHSKRSHINEDKFMVEFNQYLEISKKYE